MGNAGKQRGVRPRTEGSMELDFRYRGVRCRERIKLAPTEKNIKYCERWKARIEDEIAKKEFDYAKHFPDSPKVKFFARMPGDNITIESCGDSGRKPISPLAQSGACAQGWQSHLGATP